MQPEKQIQYASKLFNQVIEVFDDSSDNHIDMHELEEGGNIKHFLHALANMVPTQVANKLTAGNYNNLEFNHVANQLVFEFSTLERKDS